MNTIDVVILACGLFLVIILGWSLSRPRIMVMPSGVSYKVEGDLKRQRENTQFYVIDPADKTMTWVNGTDDMYEDSAGKIWRLT